MALVQKAHTKLADFGPSSKHPRLMLRFGLRCRHVVWLLAIALLTTMSTQSHAQGYATGQPVVGNPTNVLASSPLLIDVKQLSGTDFCAQSTAAFGQANSLIYNGTGDSGGSGTTICATNPFTAFQPGEFHLPSAQILEQVPWSFGGGSNAMRIIGTGRGASSVEISGAANATVLTACHNQSNCGGATISPSAATQSLMQMGTPSFSGGKYFGTSVEHLSFDAQGTPGLIPLWNAGGEEQTAMEFVAGLGAWYVPGIMLGGWDDSTNPPGNGTGTQATQNGINLSNYEVSYPSLPGNKTVQAVQVTAGGTGASASCTIAAPPAGNTGATCVANTVAGVVHTVTVTNPGTGYASAPAVTLSGGATATALLGPYGCPGGLQSITTTSVIHNVAGVTNDRDSNAPYNSIATVTLSTSPPFVILPYMTFQLSGFGAGTFTTYNTLPGNPNDLRMVLTVTPSSGIAATSFTYLEASTSNSTADASTSGGTITFQGTALVNYKDAAPSDRGFKNGTLNASGCLQTATNIDTSLAAVNSGINMIGTEVSGGQTIQQADHVEGATNGNGIGDFGPTQGDILIGNNPNNVVTNAVHISSHYGIPKAVVIINEGASGTSAPADTNLIVDDGNNNTLTRSHGRYCPWYSTDWSGTVGGVFTLCNPSAGADVANGVSIYNGALDIWLGGIDKVHADNTGLLTALSIGPKVMALSSTAPTISAGFGTGSSVVFNNGTASFRINVGTGGTAKSGTVGMPTAANGWNCYVNNITAAAGNRADNTRQTASTSSTVVVHNQTTSTGTDIAWTASDVLSFICAAF